MSLSLKFSDDTKRPPLLRFKLPVTILGLPFLTSSSLSTTLSSPSSSSPSFSLRTNFSSGPTFSLFYIPTATNSHPTPGNGPHQNPFSLSLKSGIGLFGSPRDSPLVFSAQFNLIPSNGPNPNPKIVPSFTLNFKPQCGNFSLRKSTSSSSSVPNPCPIAVNGDGEISNGYAQKGKLGGDGYVGEQELGTGFVKKNNQQLEWGEAFSGKNGFSLSGIFVMAKTAMPLTTRARVNFRWGVSFPNEGVGRPVLVLNKIGIERVEERKKKKESEKGSVEEIEDLEVLKSMCGWMNREMDDLQRGNREIMKAIEGIRSSQGGMSFGARGDERECVAKRGAGVSFPGSETAGDGERWRNRKSGSGVQETGQREIQKSVTGQGGVENELQRAIKAANASP